MSMPSVTYTCQHCDFTAGSTKLWGDFAYLIDGQEVPLTRTIGWCDDCQSIEPIEDFSNLTECLADLKEKVADLTTPYVDTKAGITHALALWNRKRHQADTDEVKGLIARIELISARKESEKCLTCGSANVIEITCDTKLEYNAEEGLFTGERETDFIHPHCGGHLIVKPCPVRFHMRFIPKRYTRDGRLIKDN